MTWTLGWIGWIAWFAIEEGAAIARGGTPATLSGHIWKWFAIGDDPHPRALTRLRRFALLAGLAWLTAHLLTGGRF